MTSPTRLAFHWSGGKDSAHALGRLLADDRHAVRCLVTTVDAATGASTVHGIPPWLLEAQADAIGLPLHTVRLRDPGLADYREAMTAHATTLRDEGIEAVGFGDLHRSGARRHHEALFTPLGLEVVEPLWQMTSHECVAAFLASGIEARIIVVDADVLGREHVGAVLDRELVDALPDGCDPCGELGEYHTVVTDAPYFRGPVPLPQAPVEHVVRRVGTSAGVREFRYWTWSLP